LRANRLSTASVDDLTITTQVSDPYPRLLHAHLVEDGGKHFLELVSAVPHTVEVQSADWVSNEGRPEVNFKPLSNHRFPLSLEARVQHASPKSVRIPYRAPPNATSYSLQVSANIDGDKQRRTVAAKISYPPMKNHPVPTSTVEEQLSRHSFLKLDTNQRSLTVRTGTWRVRGTLIVPPGVNLKIPAGTTLQFDPKGALVAHGPLHLNGTREAPVTLEGAPKNIAGTDESNWLGVAVLNANGPSHWRGVVVRNTSGINLPGWHLTGGVTFYRSDIHIDHAHLLGHQGEDALNVIASKFKFKDLKITDAASDGFDSDFSEGTIEGGVFERIGKAGGGDAIDVSGSTVTVSGTRFADIGDKALSVGERSKMNVSGVDIEGAGTGAAAKDGSTLRIDGAKITKASHAGLMAYVKKPEFGAAAIEASNIIITGTAPRARAQKGSSIIIDGTVVASEDVDVERLYDTIMQPGLRQ